MQRSEIIKSIKECLAETLNLEDVDNISTNTSLKDEHGLDSMSSLTFLMTLEDKVPNFTVNAETLEEEDLQNIESLANYVERELIAR